MVYALLLLARLALSWAGAKRAARVYRILCGITGPYLYLFRRVPVFARRSDAASIAAVLVLGLACSIFSRIAVTGNVSVGYSLAIAVSLLSLVLTMTLFFNIIVLILRLVAYGTNANIYTVFWQTIDAASRGLMFRISRIFFRGRNVKYVTQILVSIVTLLLLVLITSALSITIQVLLIMLPF
jgi:uncharacterized protein YggT (Ycf19 family)